MSKVLILSNSIEGLFCFRKEVIQAYRDKGCEVHISCPCDGNLQAWNWFYSTGCKMIETPFKRKGMNPFSDLVLMMKYVKIIKTLNPDIVLSYTIKPNIYGGIACSICHVPQLANITGLGAAVEYPGILRTLTMFLYRIGLKKAKIVFFQNQENLQFCVSHKMVKGHMRLIPGSGVNLTYHAFKPYPEESGLIKFIFIARIRKEKGIEEYLTAAKEIKRIFPNTEFHILGICEAAYEERLDEMQDEGIILYHGQQTDVRPFFAQCHCTVHPTFYPEGMSNVLLESCATGRPIITTNRAGCREIVEEGINGFIVREQDSADLVSKIKQFITLPYDRKVEMGLCARRKVEKEFDRNIVVKAYLEESKEYV